MEVARGLRTAVRVGRIAPLGSGRRVAIMIEDLEGKRVVTIRADAEIGRSLSAKRDGIPTILAQAADLLDAVLDGLDLQLLTVTLRTQWDALWAQVEISTGTTVKRVSIDPCLAVFLGQHLELPLYVVTSAHAKNVDVGRDGESAPLYRRPVLNYFPWNMPVN